MKKSYLVLVVVAMFTTLIIATSCNKNETTDDLSNLSNEEKAVKIFNLMNDKMNALDSYTCSSVAAFDMMFNDKPMNIEFDAEVMYQRNNEDLVYIEEITSVSEYDGKRDGYGMIKGFQDGKMHRRYVSNDMNIELYSSISADDFIKYLNEQEGSYGTILKASNFENCSVQDENGDWRLMFSKVTSSEMVDDLKDEMDLSLISDYLVIDDIIMTVWVSSDYYCKKIIFQPVFKLDEAEEDISEPTMSITLEYTKLNSTVAKKEDINSYNEVYDLRDLERVSKAVRDLYKSEEIAFKYTGYKPTTDATIKEIQEIDTVDYSLKNGKPTYVIFSTIPDTGKELTITYSSGKKIITSGNAANTLESNDEAEKQFIRSFMFPLGIDTNCVYNISEAQSGIYILSFKATNEQKKQILGKNAYKNYDLDFWISVTYDGDVIKKYSAQITVKHGYKGDDFISNSQAGRVVSHNRYMVEDIVYNVKK